MLGRIINHNTPYLLQRKDGTFNDPETGKKLGFDTRFMGKGEGAQVHGWGIYLSVADIRHYGNFHKRSIRIKEEIFDCEFIQYGQIKTIPLKVSRDEIRAYKLALTAGNIASHFDLIDCNPDDVKAYIQARIIESKAKIAEKESQPPSPRLASEITNEKQRLEDYQYLLDRVIVKGTRHHYDVQIPDYDGVNYISEHGTVTAKQMDMIYSALSKANADALKARCKAYKGKATGRQVYVALWQILGSDEKASKLLNKAGFVGIHYYGGRDGECYVIFNEKDAQIVSHELYGLQGISNAQMQQRELEIVKTAREIISKYHGTESPLPYKDLHDCYTELVNYYNHQQTISPKDSVAISLQQYSTPCPIAFLMGEYVKGNNSQGYNRYYEPTAGNGLLTIALPHTRTTVNELDPVRYNNLSTFEYDCRFKRDAVDFLPLENFSGVIMNPPFGNLPKGKELKRGGTIGGKDVSYTFGRIDYAIVVKALEAMYPDGRAAIIVGGKLSAKVGDYSESYWKNGKLYGQYRDFIAYLHRQYNIADIIYIDGNLYRKQGTTFPIVLILIDGRTAWNGDLDHVWHRYDPHTDSQISTFDGLFARISKHFSPSISPLFDNEIALAKLNSDTSLQLTETDKASLRNTGAYVSDDDFDYLEKVVKEMKYYEQRIVDFKISAQKAISILGRKEFWSGVYRAAYHGTAMRGTKEPYVIFIMPGHSFYGINDDNTTDIIITFKKKKDVRRSLNSCQNEHGQILCAFDSRLRYATAITRKSNHLSGTKIENFDDLKKKIEEKISKWKKAKTLDVKDFMLFVALELRLRASEKNNKKFSYYLTVYENKDGFTLRISDHHLNARTAEKTGDKYTTSITFSNDSPEDWDYFKPDQNVKAIEYVYYEDKVTKDDLISIANDIIGFVETGKFTPSVKPNEINESPENLSGNNEKKHPFKIKDKGDGFSYFDESETLVDRFYTYVKVKGFDQHIPAFDNYFWDEDGHLCFATRRKEDIKECVDFFDMAEDGYDKLEQEIREYTLDYLSDSDKLQATASIVSNVINSLYRSGRYHLEYLDTYLAKMVLDAINIADKHFVSPYVKEYPDIAKKSQNVVAFYKTKDILLKRLSIPPKQKPGPKPNTNTLRKIQPENLLPSYDSLRPVMNCILHEDGFNVCSDGYFILKQKASYPSDAEGKIEIPKRFYKMFGVNQGPQYYEGTYPNYKGVIADTVKHNINAVRLDTQDLYKYVCGLFDFYEKQTGYKLRNSAIPFYSNGKLIFCLMSDHLKKWISAAYTIGANSILYSEKDRAILMEDCAKPGELLICMPAINEYIYERYKLNNGKFEIDNMDCLDVLYRAYDFGETYAKIPHSFAHLVRNEIALLKQCRWRNC